MDSRCQRNSVNLTSSHEVPIPRWIIHNKHQGRSIAEQEMLQHRKSRKWKSQADEKGKNEKFGKAKKKGRRNSGGRK